MNSLAVRALREWCLLRFRPLQYLEFAMVFAMYAFAFAINCAVIWGIGHLLGTLFSEDLPFSFWLVKTLFGVLCCVTLTASAVNLVMAAWAWCFRWAGLIGPRI